LEEGEDKVIDDESGNTNSDPDASEEAVSESEGGAQLPLLLLYDKMWREDILLHAYELAKANKARQAWMAGLRTHRVGGREKWLEASGRPS